MKKSKKILLVFLCFAVFCLVTGFSVIKILSRPVSAHNNSQKIRFEIPSGMTVVKVSKELKVQNLIRSEKLFYTLARFPFLLKILYPSDSASVDFVLKSGIYYLDASMNIVQIQKELSSGHQDFVRISFAEGLTITKIGQLLENSEICSLEDFKKACTSDELLQKYNIPFTSCEGYLFPDTYFLTLGMDAFSVADLMISNFYKRVSSIEGLFEKSPKELFEIVTLASIVEREYRVEEEAPLIASVFRNRLRHNIGLYSCATVEYIITEIQGLPHPERIYNKDLKIESPYNTYIHAGLTPGPISNPGLVALGAATNTPKTSYYYFQIVDPQEGRHVFTKTFEEHIESHSLYTKK